MERQEKLEDKELNRARIEYKKSLRVYVHVTACVVNDILLV